MRQVNNEERRHEEKRARKMSRDRQNDHSAYRKSELKKSQKRERRKISSDQENSNNSTPTRVKIEPKREKVRASLRALKNLN